MPPPSLPPPGPRFQPDPPGRGAARKPPGVSPPPAIPPSPHRLRHAVGPPPVPGEALLGRAVPGGGRRAPGVVGGLRPLQRAAGGRAEARRQRPRPRLRDQRPELRAARAGLPGRHQHRLLARLHRGHARPLRPLPPPALGRHGHARPRLPRRLLRRGAGEGHPGRAAGGRKRPLARLAPGRRRDAPGAGGGEPGAAPGGPLPLHHLRPAAFPRPPLRAGGLRLVPAARRLPRRRLRGRLPLLPLRHVQGAAPGRLRPGPGGTALAPPRAPQPAAPPGRGRGRGLPAGHPAVTWRGKPPPASSVPWLYGFRGCERWGGLLLILLGGSLCGGGSGADRATSCSSLSPPSPCCAPLESSQGSGLCGR